MNPLLEIYLANSERLRNGYRESLGAVNNYWRQILSDIITPIPTFLSNIYSTYSGTFNEISVQRLFDFMPGYRLIHITEIKKLAMDFWTNLNLYKTSNCLENAFIIPVFANYSSDYLCYVMEDENNEYLASWRHDNCILTLKYESVSAFYQTLIECYIQNAYFLDEDGYLDYDMENEAVTGAAFNPKACC